MHALRTVGVSPRGQAKEAEAKCSAPTNSPLPYPLNLPPKHLHALDLALDGSQRGELDLVPDGDISGQDGAREDGALSPYREAVVDGKTEARGGERSAVTDGRAERRGQEAQEAVDVPGGDRPRGRWPGARARAVLGVALDDGGDLLPPHAGADPNHLAVPKLGAPEHPPHPGLDRPQGRVCAVVAPKEIDLVEDNDHVPAGHLCNDDALGRLGLHALVRVHHEQDHVDDLGAADDGADEAGVPGAVDKGDLEGVVTAAARPAVAALALALAVLAIPWILGDPGRHRRHQEGAESKVQGDPPLPALRAPVQAGGGKEGRECLHQRSLAGIDVTQHADVHVEDAVGVDSLGIHGRGR